MTIFEFTEYEDEFFISSIVFVRPDSKERNKGTDSFKFPMKNHCSSDHFVIERSERVHLHPEMLFTLGE